MVDQIPEQAENLNPASFRVLFAEDDPGFTQFMQEELEGLRGVDAVFVESGEDAIRLLEEEKKLGKPFDLVISDWHLGKGMDGIKVAIRIKDASLARQTFILSASEEELKSFILEDQLKLLGIGRILSKRSDIRNLTTIIRDERMRQIAEKA